MPLVFVYTVLDQKQAFVWMRWGLFSFTRCSQLSIGLINTARSKLISLQKEIALLVHTVSVSDGSERREVKLADRRFAGDPPRPRPCGLEVGHGAKDVDSLAVFACVAHGLK